jgi:WD40 repeat protein
MVIRADALVTGNDSVSRMYKLVPMVKQKKSIVGAVRAVAVTLVFLAAGMDLLANTAGEIYSKAMLVSSQTSSCWSPDGRQLAVTFADGRLAIFTLGRTQPQWLIQEQPSGMALFSVDWSPNGRELAVGGQESVQIWDVASGGVISTLPHDDYVREVVWSPDGRFVAAGSDDKLVWIWEVSRQTVRTKLSGHTDWVRSVAWSPNGQQVVSGSDDGKAMIFNALAGTRALVLSAHTDYVRDVAWSSDGKYIITVSDDMQAIVWNALNGIEIRRLANTHTNWIMAVDWSADGTRVAMGDTQGKVSVWNPLTGARQASFQIGGESIAGLAFSPDQQRLSIALSSTAVYTWSLTGSVLNSWSVPDAEEKEVIEDTGVVAEEEAVVSQLAVTWSPNGRQLAVGFGDGRLGIFTPGQSQVRWIVSQAGESSLFSVAWSPDGSKLAAGSENATRVWSVSSGSLEASMAQADYVRDLAWSPDGQYLAAATDDHQTWVWNVASESLRFRLSGHTDWVRGVSWSANGKRIATASDDGKVLIFSAQTGKLENTLSEHTDYVRDVVFSPDGSKLLSVSDDLKGIIWDAVTGKPLRRLTNGHTNWVMAAAWATMGNRIATGDNNGQVVIWDAETGRQTASFRPSGENFVHGLAWSPDSRQLAIALDGQTLRVVNSSGESQSSWTILPVNSRN